MSHTAVVLGAGAGGLVAAEQLRRYLPDRDRVVLVDRSDEQRLGLTHLLVLRGWREPAEVTVQPSLLRQRGVDFLQAEVEAIDPSARRVRTARGELRYDGLIVALGADLSPGLVPGLAEALGSGRAGEFYTLPGAVALRERLARFEAGRVCLVVTRLPYRCPPAPYEAALLLADLFRERGQRDAVQIDLFTPEPAPIAAAGPAVGPRILELLAAERIGFFPSAELQAVDPAGGELLFASGARERGDLLIVVPPHTPPPAAASARLGERGWVPVEPRTLRAPAEGVWAVGDVAGVRMANGLLLPRAGVFATAQAEAAARDLARRLGYAAPEPYFEGVGRCWFMAGRGAAGYVEGSFLREPGPSVELHPPSPAGFAALEAELRAWIARWQGTDA